MPKIIDLDDYQTATLAADRIGKSRRWVTQCCQLGKVPGAHLVDGVFWLVPKAWAPTAPVGRPRSPAIESDAPATIAPRDLANIL